MKLIQKNYEIILKEGIFAYLHKVLVWKKNKELQKFINKKSWDKALKILEILVKQFPENIYYKMKLASCYQKTQNKEKAFYLLQKGMNFNSNIKLEELVVTIENDLASNLSINSSYVYLGGWQNLGFIEHEYNDYCPGFQKLITKISTLEASDNELMFYSKIIRQFPRIKDYIPELFNIRKLNQENICLITMKKINGGIPKLNDRLLKDVINICRIISSMRYKEVKNWYSLPSINSVKLTPNRLISCLHFLSYIHIDYTNKELFNSLYRHMDEYNYSNQSISQIKILESIILGNKMFKHINPEIHYSVQHGDLSLGNMLKDNTINRLFIIDWGHMKVGPRWIDLAGFLGRYKIPFHKVNELYLSDPDNNNDLDLIERLFFVFTLIIAWFSVFSHEEFDEQHELYIRPAIDYIKGIVKGK